MSKSKRTAINLPHTNPRLLPVDHWRILLAAENLKDDGSEFLIVNYHGEVKTVCDGDSGNIGFYKGEVIVSTGPEPGAALNDIHNILDGKVWTPSMLDEIAAILRANNMPIRDPGNAVDEAESDVAAALQAVARGIKPKVH